MIRFLNQTLFLVITSILYSQETKPYVTCHLHGQLGNQLHEIATTLSFAWDNDYLALFPELSRTDYNIDINYKRLFFRLDASPLPRPISHTFQFSTNFSFVEIPLIQDQLLYGFFQTYKFYHHHRDKLLEIFAPDPEELVNLQDKFQHLIDHPCSVAVHVRTFNQEWNQYIPFVGLDYYKQAMKMYPEDALFVVFSDRINWCKHHFASFDHTIIFVENEDHITDFFLMSLLKHNIISNSSYSYWAAYLNQNPNKIVIAPDLFYATFLPPPYNANLPEWITLSITYPSVYPEDMYSYDAFSRSIDTK